MTVFDGISKTSIDSVIYSEKSRDGSMIGDEVEHGAFLRQYN